MSLPVDYEERVYAGVLGKIIGVYLGRPFEGWWYDRIMKELGEIRYYVHEQRGAPLIVTDDDISGTFTFVRALSDYGNRRDITAQQIGQTWLNYILERRTILWWGGVGNSTEHTAYMRLKEGIPAPKSGSIEMNGKIVAEQIGAQIFIDGWAMVAPGDPELAADLARKAGSVSHDGEALYGAQVIAAMEAMAFVESDLNKLLETATKLIPKDSVIYRAIHDIREWRAAEGDWRKSREKIAERYGYDKYGGNCHMVPNHALIIFSLLYGDDDFQKSLMIVNTSGWDTDCNSGNVGCILGIKNGLAGIEAGPDWRGPVADRLYVSAADGGRAVTDAVTETYHLVNVGRALAGEPPVAPKDGARFHFEMPGSVQGFQVSSDPDSRSSATLENVEGHSLHGKRSLAIHYRKLTAGRKARISTPTFIPPDAVKMPGYELVASPTLYPCQQVKATLIADEHNSAPVECALHIGVYRDEDRLERLYSPEIVLPPGKPQEISWQPPDTQGDPIAEIGVELRSTTPATGTVYLDRLGWDGAPDVTFMRPAHNGAMWRRAWVNGVDQFEGRWFESFRLSQNSGRGLLMQGTREWSDYSVSAEIKIETAAAAGIGARVQGMRRFYALLLNRSGKVRLLKALDGDHVLAEADFSWQYSQPYKLALEVRGNQIKGWVDGQLLVDVKDDQNPLTGGGVAFVSDTGTLSSHAMQVRPL